MTSFPLFDSLLNSTEDEVTILSYEERIELGEQIKTQIDHVGQEYIYGLIRLYQLEIDKEPFEKDPYNVKIKKNGFKFEQSKLPNRLLLMIKHFCDLHLKSIKEEVQRNNFFEKINKK